MKLLAIGLVLHLVPALTQGQRNCTNCTISPSVESSTMEPTFAPSTMEPTLESSTLAPSRQKPVNHRPPQRGIQVQPLDSRKHALALANEIAGKNIKILSAKLFLTDPNQAGTFFNGKQTFGLDQGIILSSSFAKNIQKNSHQTDELNGPGYAPLDALLPQNRFTSDACVLSIKFKCKNNATMLRFKYVFGSEDYPSNGHDPNEDLMGVFLNGVKPINDIATVSRQQISNPSLFFRGIKGKMGRTYVSVNTIYDGPLFKNNQNGKYNTALTGFTVPLEAKGVCRRGVNTLHIAVADGNTPGHRLLTANGSGKNGGGSNVLGSKAGLKAEAAQNESDCVRSLVMTCSSKGCTDNCFNQYFRGICTAKYEPLGTFQRHVQNRYHSTCKKHSL